MEIRNLIFCSVLMSLSLNMSKADIFGADIPILAEIAMTTAKELKTTLELLKVANDTQKNIKEANRQISMHMETMSRIERLATRAERLSKMKAKNHAELNNELRKIRYSLSEAKRLEKDFEKKYSTTFQAKEKISDSLELPEVDKKTLDRRLRVTESGDTAGIHAQNTAVNSALTNQILYESSYNQNLMFKEQLDFNNEQRERSFRQDKKEKAEREFLKGKQL
jgi:glutamyl/glutaminyl-tRNA synthetase